MKFKTHLKLFILSIALIILGICGLRSITIIYNYLFSPYLFETKFITEGYLNDPGAITVDSEGNVYILGGNTHIQKFNSKGEFIFRFGSPSKADGGLGNPEGIAVDPEGNIYIADAGVNCITKFDSKGKFVDKWIRKEDSSVQFYKPEDIAIDKKGNIYVVDSSCIVQKFNSKGQLIDKWDVHNPEFTQYSPSLVSIAIDSKEFVYVVYLFKIKEEKNSKYPNYETYSCIYKFDNSGKFITKWEKRGSPDELFNTVLGIAIDLEGNVLVVDCESHCIQIFDSDGKFKDTWGGKGITNGRFYLPTYITVDLEGNVYVVDSGNYRIQKFKPNPIWK